jgi:hypothetical protein
MKPIRWAGVVCLLCCSSAQLGAQVESGPAVGSKVDKLKVLVLTGEAAGKEVDFTAERKAKPTIFLFVQAEKFDRPVARFIKVLDQELAKNRDDVHIVAVWLTEDKDKAKEQLPRIQESLKLAQTTLALHMGDKNGPEGWGINADAHLTSVVAEQQKVEASIGFRSINETDVPMVLKTLKPKK